VCVSVSVCVSACECATHYADGDGFVACLLRVMEGCWASAARGRPSAAAVEQRLLGAAAPHLREDTNDGRGPRQPEAPEAWGSSCVPLGFSSNPGPLVLERDAATEAEAEETHL
jgi:hypothetical protein